MHLGPAKPPLADERADLMDQVRTRSRNDVRGLVERVPVARVLFEELASLRLRDPVMREGVLKLLTGALSRFEHVHLDARVEVDGAIAAINRQRKSDGSFLYGEYLKYSPLHPVNRPAGSLGRTQACYIALRRWGDTTVTDQNITDWLDKLITRNGWLDMGRKRPVPHESWFAVAGYFFYYGHYYAGLTTASLPAETSPPYKKKLAALIVPLQEKDGSWWDFPFYAYHQPYGTAFALLTLAECR